MQFCCYICGMVFSDGIPPLEALSTTQAEFCFVKDDEDAEQAMHRMKTRTLEGTRFQGMSAGSFCEFCLLMVLEFPQVFDVKVTGWEGRVEPSYSLPIDGMAYNCRYPKLIAARDVYKNHEEMLALAESLLFVGIVKQDVYCVHPQCDTLICWKVPGRITGNERCEKHNLTINWRDGVLIEGFVHVALSGHNYRDHEADYCNQCYALDYELNWQDYEPDEENYS